ncbi:MAG: ABC transporter permease [bacterium]
MLERSLTANWPDTINPLRLAGWFAMQTVCWSGGFGTLFLNSLAALVRPARAGEMKIRSAAKMQMVWAIIWGMPLVILLHIGLGGFLALQAFHGAIFLDAVGPVVGVGLFRNVGSQMSAMIVTALVCTHTVAELRMSRSKLDRLSSGRAIDRDVARGLKTSQTEMEPDVARLAMARVLGVALAGPVLGFIGCVSGLIAGLVVSRSVLDVPTVWFLYHFAEMLWARDLVGIVVKGILFCGLATAIACYEGLRKPEGDTSDLAVSMWRAACLGTFAILLANSGWFAFMFLSGAPFGRTVLEPPIPR